MKAKNIQEIFSRYEMTQVYLIMSYQIYCYYCIYCQIDLGLFGKTNATGLTLYQYIEIIVESETFYYHFCFETQCFKI